ncbi:MAG: hypothetical protein HZB25_05555 [Candidatus Eisenbacteria bacterium]|nr:hypothetical protein [Candidatus Eisenbacteria bacterium]
MRTPQMQWLVPFALLALLAWPARSDVLFSSFPHTPGGGWSAVGPLEPLGQHEADIACDFHIPANASYGSIVVRLALDNWWGTHVTDVMIMSDTLAGTPFPTPGRVLATRQTTAPADVAVVTVEFPTELMLEAGKTYWVALSTPADGLQSWHWSVDLVGDYRAYRQRSAGWWSETGQFCAFSVEGAPRTTDVPAAGRGRGGELAIIGWPNPFTSSSTLAYTLAHESEVNLIVCDLSGRLVRTLIAGERQGPGKHQVVWDGCTAPGVKVATGVFFASLRAGDQRAMQRLVRLR